MCDSFDHKDSKLTSPIPSRAMMMMVDKSSLPQEILFSIFQYLRPLDLLKCASVAKLWSMVADDPLLWRSRGWTDIYLISPPSPSLPSSSSFSTMASSSASMFYPSSPTPSSLSSLHRSSSHLPNVPEKERTKDWFLKHLRRATIEKERVDREIAQRKRICFDKGVFCLIGTALFSCIIGASFQFLLPSACISLYLTVLLCGLLFNHRDDVKVFGVRFDESASHVWMNLSMVGSGLGIYIGSRLCLSLFSMLHLSPSLPETLMKPTIMIGSGVVMAISAWLIWCYGALDRRSATHLYISLISTAIIGASCGADVGIVSGIIQGTATSMLATAYHNGATTLSLDEAMTRKVTQIIGNGMIGGICSSIVGGGFGVLSYLQFINFDQFFILLDHPVFHVLTHLLKKKIFHAFALGVLYQLFFNRRMTVTWKRLVRTGLYWAGTVYFLRYFYRLGLFYFGNTIILNIGRSALLNMMRMTLHFICMPWLVLAIFHTFAFIKSISFFRARSNPPIFVKCMYIDKNYLLLFYCGVIAGFVAGVYEGAAGMQWPYATTMMLSSGVGIQFVCLVYSN